MMNTALAQLRAKTDRDLAVVIRREVERSIELTGQSRYIEAAQVSRKARTLLAVANLPERERARLERMLVVPATACA